MAPGPILIKISENVANRMTNASDELKFFSPLTNQNGGRRHLEFRKSVVISLLFHQTLPSTTHLLPTNNNKSRRDRAGSEFAEDLGQRLAIGLDLAVTSRKKRSSSQPKRTLDVYQDEDENTYYTSRGASVCSALLHVMIQIDARIPEAPEFKLQEAESTRGRS